MKKNGNHRTRNYELEMALGQEGRAVSPTARPGLVEWLRRVYGPMLGRLRKSRPARAFWMLDPVSGEWRRL